MKLGLGFLEHFSCGRKLEGNRVAHYPLPTQVRTWLNTRLFSLGVVVCRCSRRRSSASTLALHSPCGWICGAAGAAEQWEN